MLKSETSGGLSEELTGKNANILLLMSGSIACAKASSLISEWSKQDHSVRVACTHSVAEFVGPATLQGLGAEMVFDNVFATLEGGYSVMDLYKGVLNLTAGINGEPMPIVEQETDSAILVWDAYEMNKNMVLSNLSKYWDIS